MDETVGRVRLRELASDVKLPDEAMERLRAWQPDQLVELALDEAEPWWRRKHCLIALAGRIPPGRASELLTRAYDVGAPTSVRIPLLETLAAPDAPYADELLTWLREQSDQEQPYGLDLAIMRARTALADLSAADALATLAADPWWHREPVGREGLDTLIDSHGLPAVLAQLGATSPEELLTDGTTEPRRLVAQRLVDDVTPALADTSTRLARRAYQYLSETDDHESELRQLAEKPGQAQFWALAVLHARGMDIRPAWNALGRPRIELPDVPDDIRAAIVRTYVPGQRDTDPRWLLEKACLDPASGPDESELIHRAVTALENAGLRPRNPISAGDLYQQGEGTFFLIKTEAGDIMVSTLGPFIRRNLAEPDDDRRTRDVLINAGFHEIDDTLADTRFDGLAVYYFGSRGPLDVGDLLFYWQD